MSGQLFGDEGFAGARRAVQNRLLLAFDGPYPALEFRFLEAGFFGELGEGIFWD